MGKLFVMKAGLDRIVPRRVVNVIAIIKEFAKMGNASVLTALPATSANSSSVLSCAITMEFARQTGNVNVLRALKEKNAMSLVYVMERLLMG